MAREIEEIKTGYKYDHVKSIHIHWHECRLSEECLASREPQREDPGCGGHKAGKDTGEWEIVWAIDKQLGGSRV
jgi:hypothetical protein